MRTTNEPEYYEQGQKIKVRRQDLIEPGLSYSILGVLFRVFNELGPGLYEKNYQKAVIVGFLEKGIKFKQQLPIKIRFSDMDVGTYFADFLIEDKIILELKTGNHINRKHARQLLAYLKSINLKLGLLAYFGSDNVSYKRIINLDS